MTGCYSGQFAMEGFLNLYWKRWKRVLLTRSIAILPTLFLTIFADLNQLTQLNDGLNALMTLQLPFALLPTLTFSSSAKVMGRFRNDMVNRVLATLLSVLVIGINLYFVYTFAERTFAFTWLSVILLVMFTVYYMMFILYLVGCYLYVLGFHWVARLPLVGCYLIEPDTVEHCLDGTKPSESEDLRPNDYGTGQTDPDNPRI